MACPKHVVFAFIAAQKPAQTTELSNRSQTLAPAADEFVCVGLMSGVPHDAIIGSFENVVKRESQLHGAQRRSQVAADFRDDGYHFLADLLGKLGQLGYRQLANVSRIFDVIK